MFCPNCGTSLPDEAKFCGACGKPLPQMQPKVNLGKDADYTGSYAPQPDPFAQSTSYSSDAYGPMMADTDLHTTAGIKAFAKPLVMKQFGTALLALILTNILSVGVNLIPIVGSVAALVIGGPLNMGATSIYMNIVRDKKTAAGEMFQPFSTCFGGAFVTFLLQGIFIALWSLLLVVPGIMKSFSYAMTYYVMNREGVTGMDALKRSSELMKGHRMELFMLELSFILWWLLCLVTCGLAYFYVGPYLNASMTVFYDRVYSEATGR